MNNAYRPRRTCLSVPGSSQKMIDKSKGLPADEVFLDLEDAVAPSEKENARAPIVAALNGLDWGKKTRAVRINGTHTHWCADDLTAVVEGAGAVGVAALLAGRAGARDAAGTTAVILSGGNVDPGLLGQIVRRHESQAGRRCVLLARLPDRPGSLALLLSLVGELGANLLDVGHIREGFDLHVRESAVQLVLETRGPEHAAKVARAVRQAGYGEPIAVR